MDQMQLVSLIGVAAVLFGIILFNNVSAARRRAQGTATVHAAGATSGKAGTSMPGTSGPHPTVDPLLCKFARHGGDVVGETVAFDGDRLVIKQAGEFKLVPRAQAMEQDGEVVLTGPIDWDKARADGKAWHQSRRKADESVAGQLTRSEDVKSPALDAFKRRDEREE